MPLSLDKSLFDLLSEQLMRSRCCVVIIWTQRHTHRFMYKPDVGQGIPAPQDVDTISSDPRLRLRVSLKHPPSSRVPCRLTGSLVPVVSSAPGLLVLTCLLSLLCIEFFQMPAFDLLVISNQPIKQTYPQSRCNCNSKNLTYGRREHGVYRNFDSFLVLNVRYSFHLRELSLSVPVHKTGFTE